VKRSVARWTLLIAPLLIVAVSLPLALSLVEPNGVYGYRTAESMASEAAWYSANRASGIAGVIGGIVTFSLAYLLVRMEIAEARGTVFSSPFWSRWSL
jgi:uncharacterized membrane protein